MQDRETPNKQALKFPTEVGVNKIFLPHERQLKLRTKEKDHSSSHANFRTSKGLLTVIKTSQNQAQNQADKLYTLGQPKNQIHFKDFDGIASQKRNTLKLVKALSDIKEGSNEDWKRVQN